MIYGRTDTFELVDLELDGNGIHEERARDKFRDLPEGNLPFVPLYETDEPAFDSTTQRLEESLNWLADRVERQWTVVAMSTAEIVGKAVASGYLVEPENFTLRLEEADRNSFAQFLVLVNTALDLGLIDNSFPQALADNTGVLHTVDTNRFRQIMVGYGFYYKSLWDTALGGN